MQVQFGSFLDRCEHYDLDFDPKLLSAKGHGRGESHKSKARAQLARPATPARSRAAGLPALPAAALRRGPEERWQ